MKLAVDVTAAVMLICSLLCIQRSSF